jgi:predicted transposase YbfD/YdcC
VLALKTNHRHLCLGVAAGFEKSLAEGAPNASAYYVEAAEKASHGRLEQREHWVMAVPEHLKRATKSWANLQTLMIVRRQRYVDDRLSCEDSYYISSLPLSVGAEVRARAVRSHWSVENELHWSLDVGFREDTCQVRRDNAPANLACLRRLALVQLKQETSKKLGIQGKRRRAGWDNTYLETVLNMGGI